MNRDNKLETPGVPPTTVKIDNVYLLPGEAKFAKRRTLISTLFGSCVGVCLYDKKNRWGGVNHYMLPYEESGGLDRGKYGDFAINALIQVATRLGSEKRDLVATIVGGGNVVGHLGALQKLQGMNIGERNIEVAIELLAKHGIRITHKDVGGRQGRKIKMDTQTNEVEIRKIATSSDTQERAKRLDTLRQRKIRVLVVDDSSTVRHLIRTGIEMSDDMEVIAEAADPFEARAHVLEHDPDVLCLDVIMPRMDGHAFLKKIMRYKPIPTVIVSTIAKEGSEMRKKLFEAGAVDVIDKEDLRIYQGMDILKRVLLPKLRAAAHTVVKQSSPT